MVVRRVWLLAALLGVACRPAAASEVPGLPLVVVAGDHAQTLDARSLAAGAPITVLVFFSADCHYLDAHEPRLRALYDEDHPRGVQFAMVDSEVRASPERDAEEARRHGYPFPILYDAHARLADALGAEYAGYAVVLDAGGHVRYRGGIDSDKTHLRDDAAMYLRDAVDALLDHREPPVVEAKTLGCALQKW